jgi:hypothetical protein
MVDGEVRAHRSPTFWMISRVMASPRPVPRPALMSTTCGTALTRALPRHSFLSSPCAARTLVCDARLQLLKRAEDATELLLRDAAAVVQHGEADAARGWRGARRCGWHVDVVCGAEARQYLRRGREAAAVAAAVFHRDLQAHDAAAVVRRELDGLPLRGERGVIPANNNAMVDCGCESRPRQLFCSMTRQLTLLRRLVSA